MIWIMARPNRITAPKRLFVTDCFRTPSVRQSSAQKVSHITHRFPGAKPLSVEMPPETPQADQHEDATSCRKSGKLGPERF